MTIKTETKVVLAVIAVVTAFVLARRTADAVWSGVAGAADYLWNGPADAAQSYQDSLAAARANNDLNPFTYNPHNYRPEDLIPAGYRVNQWGGLERIGGATGSW